MPEKLGNGGHSLENYDPNTGKYKTDGVPNKYYDNPDEKKTARNEKRLNNLNLWRDMGEISDEEYEKEYKELHKSIESFDIDVNYMTQEELLTEIGMHKDFFVENGVHLVGFDNYSFGGDLRLKCANFRQLHKLMEKYPIDLNGLELSWGSELFLKNSHAIACTTNTVSHDDIWFGDSLFFNPDYFDGYDSVMNRKKRQQLNNDTMSVSDDEYSLVTNYITHEYGHLLFYKILEKSIEQNGGKKKWLEDAKNVFENDFAYNEEIRQKYNNEYNDNGIYFYIKDQNSVLLEKEAKKLYNEILRKNVYQKFVEDEEKITDNNFNYDIYDLSRRKYQNELSKYARTSLDEEFAELFASIEGGNPTKAAKNLRSWLKDNGIVRED